MMHLMYTVWAFVREWLVIEWTIFSLMAGVYLCCGIAVIVHSERENARHDAELDERFRRLDELAWDRRCNIPNHGEVI